jgi:hypothetical protein
MLPQVPQLPLSIFRSRQIPLQLARPPGQFSEQAEVLHTWPGAQMFPQAPQLKVSDLRSRQLLSHWVSPA